jgi:hypothetical protein
LTGNQSICSWSGKSSHELFPSLFGFSVFAAADLLRRKSSGQDSSPPPFPRISRAPRGFRVGRRAARRRVPSDPLARGEQTPRFACRPQAGQAENRLRSRLSCAGCASLHVENTRWLEQPPLRSRPPPISSCTSSERLSSRPTPTPSRGRADESACSLRFPFVFLLDFLLVVPDIERHLGKKIKKIWVTRVANLISEIVISTPNVI